MGDSQQQASSLMLYKLTDKDGKTRAGKHNECLWGEGVTHKAKGRGKQLCSPAVIHAYTHPLFAVLMDPIHGEYGASARLWEAEGEVVASDGTKVGCKVLTTIREIPLPKVTLEQRVRFGILVAKTVCTDLAWNAWADAWLDGSDRSARAARAALTARSARAARATWAAEVMACAAEAGEPACAAEEVAYAAEEVAYAASVAYALPTLDLAAAIAEEAVKTE